MPPRFTPKVVTANALLDGDAVWLTEDDHWSPLMSRAELITDEAHADLRLLQAKARASEIAGAYLADARLGADGPEPVHFREAFRTRGPSNYPHGKQVETPPQT
ncbi:DUF2849 domain-containing protein [Yoonia vestfoldensis]|uniref:Sulfite reductase n=1 Tax=Yoonia vestfoldensis SKA53 TaxID=314232 RepID=A3V458_9RHOB|nr:DUF2849 domain-containing protein [Yoonia vestfoldensis]EAQ07265.1 hypothetical protein SKA53_02676 [Yoonia vestfoldensis SKA53]